MVRNLTSMILMSVLLSTGIYAQAADSKAGASQDPKSTLVTESEFAKWLVNVLGLTRTLPAAPTARECFAALMQNGITPKAGWNSTNLVTMGTLARVVTEALHKQAEVENKDDDNSWIQCLKKNGIDFGTIGQAMDVLGPLDPAYAGQAAVVSTDPLKKQAKIRPLGEEQFGTTLQPVLTPIAITAATPVSAPVIQQVFQQAPFIPAPPPPMTPTSQALINLIISNLGRR